MERAAAPVFKKTGKPVMYRSQILRKKKIEVVDKKRGDDELELEAFLARDMLC